MERFLKKGVIFITILIVYMAPNYFINLHFIKADLDLPGLSKSNILIAGDSATQRALNPVYMDSAFSIADHSEPYYITYWKIKRILKQYNNIETIIIGFATQNFTALQDYKLSADRWTGEFLNKIYPIEEFDSIPDIEINRSKYYKVLMRKMCIYPERYHYDWLGKYENSNRNHISDYETIINNIYFYNGKNAGISRNEENSLKKIINLCKKKNIKLILISCPVTNNYLERVPVNFIEYFNQLKNDLIREGVTVWDYRNMTIEKSKYLNSNHLNEYGAKMFTPLIADRLKDHILFSLHTN